MLQPHPGDQQYGEPFFIPFLTGLQARLAEKRARPDGGDGRARRLPAGAAAPRRRGALGRRRRARLDAARGRAHRLPDRRSASPSRRSAAASRAASLSVARPRFREGRAPTRSTASSPAAIAASPPSARRSTSISATCSSPATARRCSKHGIEPDPELVAAGFINEAGGYAVTPEVMRSQGSADRDHLQQ